MKEYIVRTVSVSTNKKNTGDKIKYYRLALRNNITKQEKQLKDISVMPDNTRIETYNIAPRGSIKATQNKLALQRLADLKRDVERMRDDEGKSWHMWVENIESKPTVEVSKNFYQSIPFLMNDSSKYRAIDFQAFIRNHFPQQMGLNHKDAHSPLNYKAWLGKLKELKGNLSISVLKRNWGNLKFCGGQAVDLKLIDSMPQSVKPSKGFFKDKKSDIYVATEEELKALDEIDIINHPSLRYTDMATRLRYEDIRKVFMFSAIYTGIRPQSLQIMKWSQITEEKGKLKIDVIPNKMGVEDYWLYCSLDAYQYLGKRGADDDYVFPFYLRKSNEYKSEKSITAMTSRGFANIRHHAGIKNDLLTLRQCRHTHALKTLQSTKNNMWAVKERLGHKNMATTQKHYAKFLKDFQEDTLKNINTFSKYQTKKNN